MKILFQGGWKKDRDEDKVTGDIKKYCKSLARFIVDSEHQLILTSTREHCHFIASEIAGLVNNNPEELRKKVLFLLPERIRDTPSLGSVQKFDGTKWWQDERTYVIQQSDALIVTGGGRGTFDVIQKAILANKPVFYPKIIKTNS